MTVDKLFSACCLLTLLLISTACGPAPVEPGEDGHVFVLDTDNARIVELTKAGDFVRAMGTCGVKATSFWVEPGQDGLVYVTDSRQHRVVALVKAPQAGVSKPCGVLSSRASGSAASSSAQAASLSHIAE